MAPWSKEELAIVVQLVDEHGPKWKTIGLELEQRLPGRNIAQTRNAFLRMVQGQRAQAGGNAHNKCKVCGEPKLGHICGGHEYGELHEMVARKSNRKHKRCSNDATKRSFSIHSPEGAPMTPMSPQSSTSMTKTTNMSSNNSTASASDVVNQVGNDSDDDFAGA